MFVRCFKNIKSASVRHISERKQIFARGTRIPPYFKPNYELQGSHPGGGGLAKSSEDFIF